MIEVKKSKKDMTTEERRYERESVALRRNLQKRKEQLQKREELKKQQQD